MKGTDRQFTCLSVPFICHIIVIDSVSAAVLASAVPALPQVLPVHMQPESHASLILYPHQLCFYLYSAYLPFAFLLLEKMNLPFKNLLCCFLLLLRFFALYP